MRVLSIFENVGVANAYRIINRVLPLSTAIDELVHEKQLDKDVAKFFKTLKQKQFN